MFVGGLLGFLLDNTIPGSPEERFPTKSQKNFLLRAHIDTAIIPCQRPSGVGTLKQLGTLSGNKWE